MPIFKRLIAGAALLALAACSEEQALRFAVVEPAQGTAAAAPKPPRQKDRQTEVLLAGGRVQLVAPSGFCVNSRGLRRGAGNSFAFLARCDALGQSEWSGGAPLAVITAAIAPQGEGGKPPSSGALAALAVPGKASDKSDGKYLSLVRVSGGKAPVKGLSGTHWRGAFAVNGQVVMVGLYAGESSYALGGEGAEILRALARGTHKASAKLDPEPKTPAKRWLSRLVE